MDLTNCRFIYKYPLQMRHK